MNKELFWTIIEDVKEKSNSDNEQLTINFNKRLSVLSIEELLHFQFIYELYEIAIISVPSNLIWTAQFLINEGSYTNTYNFTGWLIIQGKKVYLDALANADTLAQINTPKNNCEYTELRLLAAKLYKEKTGIKKKAFQKVESDFWNKPETEKEQAEIKSEIVLSDIKRDRNWKIPDLEDVLPNLFKKVKINV
ncbi:DUF4240 domain-containing protein [Maribacter forsetii]|uniref:DUF4240 domain-containing protein n=1 Tax=Maribacter forsetii TaxID=444515 RepID=UPI000560A9ED|nr:DUF4240 domain-containing protein [Maribacter forsetii]